MNNNEFSGSPEISPQKSLDGGISLIKFINFFLCPAVLLLAILIAVCSIKGIDFYKIAADPLEYVGGQSPYVGFLSMLGGILWAFSVAIVWFTTALVWKDFGTDLSWLRYLTLLTALLVMLLLDDVYRLHENFKYIFIERGSNNYRMGKILEGVFYMFYAGYIAFLGLTMRRVIARTNVMLVALFVGLMTLSTVADLLVPGSWVWHHTLEESLKFLGIVVVLGYCADLSRRTLYMWR